MAQPDKNGGTLTSPNRAPAVKVLSSALANNRVASALISALGAYSDAAIIIATSTSTTVDFGTLMVGDYLIHIPAVAGNSMFETVVTAGTKPSAAVVGDMYIVMRLVNLDSNNPLVPPAPAELTGRTTGDGGKDF